MIRIVFIIRVHYPWYRWLFLQGTTGQPKGAVLSHHNLVNNAFCIGNRSQYDKQVISLAIMKTKNE